MPSLPIAPLPSIAFNYLGNRVLVSGSSDGNGDVPGFLPAGDAPSLPVTVSDFARDGGVGGGCHGGAGASRRRYQVELRYPTAVLDLTDVAEIAARWG